MTFLPVEEVHRALREIALLTCGAKAHAEELAWAKANGTRAPRIYRMTCKHGSYMVSSDGIEYIRLEGDPSFRIA